MIELITASIRDSDVSKLVSFPRELMNAAEKDIVLWILAYVGKYGKPPTLARIERRFPHFVPLEDEEDTPLDDIYTSTLDRKFISYTLTQLSDIERVVRADGTVPSSKIAKLLNLTVEIGGGVAQYSTFNRDAYFRPKGHPFGFRMIDRVTGGLSKGDFGLIVGRLGAKKTTIAQWITFNWWKEGLKVLFISNEAFPIDVFARIDAMRGKFNPLILRLTDEDYVRRTLAKVVSKKVSGSGDIFIPVKRLSTPSEVAALARNTLADVIVIDGVYLMAPDEGGYSSKWERVSAVSNSLKQYAMDLELPILGTTQLKRLGGRVEIDAEDIAYADALGQDADFVITVTPDKTNQTIVELSLLKNRYGKPITALVEVDFDKMTVIDEAIGADDELVEEFPKRKGAW